MKPCARSFVEQSIWDGKPTCPKCGSRRHGLWTTREGHYRCKDCRKIYSVRIGTVFEKSPLAPARHRLYAICLMQTARKGISSPQPAEALGITQKSAWFMLNRICASCADETLRMSGEVTMDVKMDATHIGGKETDNHSDKKRRGGRGSVGKQAVPGVRNRATGKMRALPVDADDKACGR